MHKLLRATALTSLLLGASLAAKAADLPPAPPMAPRAPVAYIPAAPMAARPASRLASSAATTTTVVKIASSTVVEATVAAPKVSNQGLVCDRPSKITPPTARATSATSGTVHEACTSPAA